MVQDKAAFIVESAPLQLVISSVKMPFSWRTRILQASIGADALLSGDIKVIVTDKFIFDIETEK